MTTDAAMLLAVQNQGKERWVHGYEKVIRSDGEGKVFIKNKTKVACSEVYFRKLPFDTNNEKLSCMSLCCCCNIVGLIMSQCLSVIAQGEVKGVTCADIKVDTFFSEIVDFRLGQLSYSFFIDSRSRILIHPLLPRPDIYYKEPRFLDIESVELSSETSEIKQAMLRQVICYIKRTYDFLLIAVRGVLVV